LLPADAPSDISVADTASTPASCAAKMADRRLDGVRSLAAVQGFNRQRTDAAVGGQQRRNDRAA